MAWTYKGTRGPQIVVAPDKFKGSADAVEVAAALARGLRRTLPEAEVVEVPIADGGEGTVDMMLRHGFAPVRTVAAGPLGKPTPCRYASDGTTAVIEMATVAGIGVLGRPVSPKTAGASSTRGVGELIAHALDGGHRRIVLGLGGSATTDGGAGALAALGARLETDLNEPVRAGGLGLLDLARIDFTALDTRLTSAEIIIACDVDNPLTGPAGAARIFGPQKGAGPNDVVRLDVALDRWADAVAATLGIDRRTAAGAGAAGGLAFGLTAIGGEIVPAADFLLDLVGFHETARDADLMIVGEGSLDEQSLRGKGPIGIARAARKTGPPVVAVAGRCTLDAEALRAAGVRRVHRLSDLEPNEGQSMANATDLLETLGTLIASEDVPKHPAGVDKVVGSAAEAVADVPDGATLAVGGFGLCGIPSVLIEALLGAGTRDLEAVSNNCGVDDWGLGRLLAERRIRRMISSYVGENKEFARQYLSGELEVELTPQGTLAERMRAGGSGIPAFFTATGVGTQVAEGGLPWRYDSSGDVVVSSPAKQTQVFETAEGPKEFVLEHAIVADFGLVRAWRGDRHGNLVYRDSARNFNPLAAMCGRVTIAEVEELVEPGELDPNEVHTPGVFVQRVVPLTREQAAEKRIEKRTVRPKGDS